MEIHLGRAENRCIRRELFKNGILQLDFFSLRPHLLRKEIGLLPAMNGKSGGEKEIRLPTGSDRDGRAVGRLLISRITLIKQFLIKFTRRNFTFGIYSFRLAGGRSRHGGARLRKAVRRRRRRRQHVIRQRILLPLC